MSLFNNAKWVAISQVVKVLVQLINIVYLARLIPPGEYGIMAMALVIINFGMLIRDLGTAAAIIQRKKIDDDIINSIFWLNLFMGIGIALSVIAFSPLVSSFFHEPKLILVLLCISIIFPLSSSSSAHLALLERESKFKKIASIEIFSSVIGVGVALFLAYKNFGVYSLVWQTVIFNALSTIQFWKASGWRPCLKKMFVFSGLKEIFGFSAHLSIFNLINYFSRNADSLIIGRYMAPPILGAYSLAYRIMLFPLASLTFVAARSLFPILSKNQDDHVQLKKTYLDCVYAILFLVIPLMSGLAFLSKPFVILIFGKQWMLTADILLWLAPTAIIQSVLSTTGTVFMAKGRTDILMKLGILGMILYMSAFIAGVQFNIITFAKFYFIANVINFLPAMFLLMKIINGTLLEFFKRILPIVCVGFLMIVVMYVTNRPLKLLLNEDSFVYLIAMSIVGAFTYVLISLFFLKDVKEFVLNK
ncbi:TPA: colanic acid exporter, partial [Klebsiella pneumoniae subsp. pneumoniae]|nr:colanic acid exporter [Klebsiella pneumoniae subsp. pneumoniae]